MKSRCCCENVSCLPFVAFWCKEEKFSSSFGRWTAFDDPRPVTDRQHNARRWTLGCDSTAAEKWSTATCVSSPACKCNKVDLRTQAHVRCRVHARPRPVQLLYSTVSTWRMHVISAVAYQPPYLGVVLGWGRVVRGSSPGKFFSFKVAKPPKI